MKFGAVVGIAALSATCWLASGCSRHRQEAVILANQGDAIVELDPNGAIAKYEQAVKLDPSNHLVMYKLSKAYKKKEEWDKVASTLARATELESGKTHATYFFERGYALEQQAEKKTISYKECIEPFTKCIEVDPNKDECYSHLGTAYLWTDDEQKALLNYDKAVQFRPDNLFYYAQLADLYIRLDLIAEAEQVLKEAKGFTDPNDKELFGIHVLLSEILQERNDLKGMVTELEAAKRIGGKDHPEILFNLGSTYAKIKPPRKAEALQMLKGFTARGCKSKKAEALYKNQCVQAAALIQKLQGAGG